MRVYCCVSDAGHLISLHSRIPMAAGLTSSAPQFSYIVVIWDCAKGWYKSSRTLLWSVCSICFVFRKTLKSFLSKLIREMASRSATAFLFNVFESCYVLVNCKSATGWHWKFLPEASFGLQVLFLFVCLCINPRACLQDNLTPIQAEIMGFGPEVQNTWVKILIVFRFDWPQPSRSNLT